MGASSISDKTTVTLHRLWGAAHVPARPHRPAAGLLLTRGASCEHSWVLSCYAVDTGNGRGEVASASPTRSDGLSSVPGAAYGASQLPPEPALLAPIGHGAHDAEVVLGDRLPLTLYKW